MQAEGRTSDSVSFAALLGTKDEADLLPMALKQLRQIGVEVIVVLDYGSTDGSLEILREEEKRGDIWLFHPGAQDSYAAWDRASEELARGLSTDWVFFTDTDELWLPASGSLAGSADLDHADVLSVPRYNVVLGPDGAKVPPELTPASYDQLLLYASGVADIEERMAADAGVPWISGALEPKVLVRPHVMVSIGAGDHDVEIEPGNGVHKAIASDLIIAHVSFSSRQRFERKVENVQRDVARHPEWFTDGQGWHWVRYAELAEQGKIGDEYDLQALDEDAITGLQSRHVVRSAQQMLRRRVPRFDSEAAYRAVRDSTQPWIHAAGEICRIVGVQADSTLRVLRTGQYPTILVPPDRIIKLYGRWDNGAVSFQDEVAALDMLARDPHIPAPSRIASGSLDDHWRYLVMSLLQGLPLDAVREDLGRDQLSSLAAWLGRYVRRQHAIELDGDERQQGSRRFNGDFAQLHARLPEEMASRGVLPAHLQQQLKAWLPSPAQMSSTPASVVLVHADLHDGHLLGRYSEGRFQPTGVIDFNRARIGHPMYELGQIWRWVTRGDGQLMAAFLAEANLPGHDEPGFPKLALAWSLLHQGVAQERIDLPVVEEAASLDELAQQSFGASGG